MDPLDREDTALIVDCCLGLCPLSRVEEVQELIARDDRAAVLHLQIQTSLAFLSYLPAEACPDHLVERTIDRLRGLAARRAHEEEPGQNIVKVDSRRRFGNIATITAIAAAIVVAAGVLIRPVSPTHHHQYPEVSPLATESPLPNIRPYGSDYIRFQNTGWLEVPSSMADVHGPIEFRPGHLYPFVEVDPPIPPFSLEEILERQLIDHPVQPRSSLVPGTEE